eukprot:scaffold3920_cov134-Isochrysis_galbana.AAC.10
MASWHSRPLSTGIFLSGAHARSKQQATRTQASSPSSQQGTRAHTHTSGPGEERECRRPVSAIFRPPSQCAPPSHLTPQHQPRPPASSTNTRRALRFCWLRASTPSLPRCPKPLGGPLENGDKEAVSEPFRPGAYHLAALAAHFIREWHPAARPRREGGGNSPSGAHDLRMARDGERHDLILERVYGARGIRDSAHLWQLERMQQ